MLSVGANGDRGGTFLILICESGFDNLNLTEEN